VASFCAHFHANLRGIPALPVAACFVADAGGSSNCDCRMHGITALYAMYTPSTISSGTETASWMTKPSFPFRTLDRKCLRRSEPAPLPRVLAPPLSCATPHRWFAAAVAVV
jgi:hypothetical protein